MPSERRHITDPVRFEALGAGRTCREPKSTSASPGWLPMLQRSRSGSEESQTPPADLYFGQTFSKRSRIRTVSSSISTPASWKYST